MVEKFGVGPDKVVEVQALAGDSTDNVPGVPGIGIKTAAQLIGEFGDLETLLANAGSIKQNKRRENLIEFADQARISRQLVLLDEAVPLNTGLEALAVEPVDGLKALGFLKALEFTTLTNRVAETCGADIEAALAPTLEIKGWDAPQPQAAPAGTDAEATPTALAAHRAAGALERPIDRDG